MNSAAGVWIGADPGGIGNFGVCVLDVSGRAHTCVVDCADEAIDWVAQQLEEAPAGVGVDAPLWFSSGRSSDRTADRWIRQTYGLTGGQVQTANSLRGAALVQAAMFAERIRERFGKVPVTESHPKAVLKALQLEEDGFKTRYSIRGTSGTEHERDAMISAVAAREDFSGHWTRDLSLDRHQSEQDPSQYHLAPVHYWWPDR